MKKKPTQRAVTLFLIVCMMLTSYNSVFAAAASIDTAAAVSASEDFKGHWAESRIRSWIDQGLIQGYGDGSFKPDHPITRAEFMALVNRSFGFTDEAVISFHDLDSGNWAYAEAAKAVKAGYMAGYTDGTIGADKPISRQEAAVIVYRLLGSPEAAGADNDFSDAGTFADWAKTAINAAVANDVFAGYASDRTFRPNQPITRAEALVVLDRTIPLKPVSYDKAGTYGPASGTETLKGNVTVTAPGVILRNVTVTGNLVVTASVGEGDFTAENVTVQGTTAVNGGGDHSVHFKNSVLKDVTVAKEKTGVRLVFEGSSQADGLTLNASVRIETSGDSRIKQVQISDKASVALRGKFESVQVKGNDAKLSLDGATVDKLSVEEGLKNVSVDVNKDSTVMTLNLDSAAQVSGEGTIQTAVLSPAAKAGTTFGKPPVKTQEKGSDTPATTPTTPTTPNSGPNAVHDTNTAYVDAYYDKTFGTDSYNSLSVDTSKYALNYGLAYGGAQSLTIKNSHYPDANIFSSSGTMALVPSVVKDGVLYSPVYNIRDAKAWFRKSGQVMWEIQLNDIVLKNTSGSELPLKIQMTYHFWDDKFYVTTKWLPTDNIAGIDYAELTTYLDQGLFDKYNAGGADHPIPQSGPWTDGTVYDGVTLFDSHSDTHGAFSYEVVNKSGTDSLVMQSGNYRPASDGRLAIAQRAYDKEKHNGSSALWKSGHAQYTYTQIFVDGKNNATSANEDIAAEMNPLDASEFQVVQSFPYAGSRSLGYDNTTGAYTIEIYTPDNSKSPVTGTTLTNYYKDEPNQYPSVKFQIKNDGIKRKFRLQTRMALTGDTEYAPGVTGSVAMLTDEKLAPNGIPVQVSKKWDNLQTTRMESYNNSYASFDVSPHENRTMWHRTSFQNWGNKINVGLPSLDLTNYFDWGYLWLESNVGLSETLTYLPDNDNNASLADFRAQGGMRLEGEDAPWFANAGGLEFLQLKQGNNWIDAKRRGPGIRLDKTGPNVSEFRMNLRTPDGKPDVKVSVTSTLLPSVQGSRVFFKLHYDFLSDLSFTDIKKELSLFSMGDLRYATPVVHKMAYANAAGQTESLDIQTDNTWNVRGAPLSEDRPWVAFYQSETNNVGFVVDRFSGKFNEKTVNQAAVSMYAGIKPTAYLVPNTDDNQVKAGDYADVTLELYTWNSSLGTDPIAHEAASWPSKAAVSQGTLLSEFPAEIAADKNKAVFTLQGGVDYVPVTIEGFDSYSEPVLERRVNDTWTAVDQSVGTKDFWQTNIDPATGKYSFTFVLPADPNEQTYRVRLSGSPAPEIPAAKPRFASKHAFLEDFAVEERVEEAVIDNGCTISGGVSRCKVSVVVDPGTDLTRITPLIKVSDQASISPASGIQTDFSQPVDYTVTAEDGTTKRVYTVTVTKKKVQENNAITALKTSSSVEPESIDAANHTVKIKVKYGTNLAALKPTITVSPNATISPPSGVAQDFTNPVVYTVTDKDGKPQAWTVTAVVMPPNIAVGKTYDGTKPNYGPSYVPDKAFDNNLNSKWAPTGLANQWMSVDFGAPAAFDEIVLTEGSGSDAGNRWLQDYSLQYHNGTDWIDIPGTVVTGAAAHPGGTFTRSFQFDAVTASKLRLFVTQAGGGIYLHEMAVYNHNGANDITGFELEQQAAPAVIDPVHHTVTASVYSGTDRASLAPIITVSGGAAVSPASGASQDFTNPVTYTVTAADGTHQPWTVTVNVSSTLSGLKEIKSFTTNKDMKPAVIDGNLHTITLQVYGDTDLTALTPTIMISDGASVSPASGAPQDFTNPVIYTVTAADGTQQTWTVSAAVAQSNAKAMSGFSISGETSPAAIDPALHTVTAEVYADRDVTALSPVIAVSPGASVSPSSGTAQDFTNPVAYSVTAEDGTAQIWTVTVNRNWGTSLARSGTYSGTAPTWGDQWYGPERAFDGDMNTKWAPQGLTDQSISVDFGTSKSFHSIVIVEGDDGVRYLADYVLQYDDGTGWVDIPGTSVTNGIAHSGGPLTKIFAFDPIQSSKIRLKINQAGAGIYLYELGVY